MEDIPYEEKMLVNTPNDQKAQWINKHFDLLDRLHRNKYILKWQADGQGLNRKDENVKWWLSSELIH